MKVTSRELIDATRQIALLARLGYPLGEGLKAMGEESRWLGSIGEDLESGDALSEAVRRHPRVFSPFYAAMVRAAEEAERPAGILTELSRWLERADSVQRRVRTALFYPLLVANVLLLELWFLATWALPDVLLPLAGLTGEVPGWLTSTVESDLLGMAVLAALVLLNLAAWREGPFAARLSGLLPWAGRLQRMADQGIWARALGSLLAAGVELPRALREAAPVVRTGDLRERLARLCEAVERGSLLSATLADTPGLDPYLAWSAAAGETREDLAPLMLDAADHLDEQVDRRADHYVRMAEPWAMAGIGLLVALGLLSFWWPFYRMVSGIA